MREIRFRRPIFYADGSFDRFHYWGLINGKTILPISLDDKREITEKDQQFTGLKDKNGKEIYESDIVLNPVRDDEIKNRWWIVSWYMGGFILIEVNSPCMDNKIFWDQLTIIGNTHENPKLLGPT